jgi:hypothetical protein
MEDKKRCVVSFPTFSHLLLFFLLIFILSHALKKERECEDESLAERREKRECS